MTVLGDGVLKIILPGVLQDGAPSVQPASIDLTFGDRIGRLISLEVDYESEPEYHYYYITRESPLRMPHGWFRLACTAERVVIPAGMLGEVVGKSSWARKGLLVEAAGLVDPGWDGRLTLELFNFGPAAITIRPGDPICQLKLSRVEGNVDQYKGRYQGAASVEGAKRAVENLA